MTGTGPAATEDQAVHRHLMRFGEADSLVTPLWEERGTSIRAVAGRLATLWDPPGATDGGGALVTEKGLAHARASVLNLIVTVWDSEAADRVVRTLMGLGVRHPSRAIILAPEPHGSGPKLDARISAHCHDPSGRPDRVCYEEVVLTVRGEAATHLNGIVAPLLIHDPRSVTRSSISWWSSPTGSSSTRPTSRTCCRACDGSPASGAAAGWATSRGSGWPGGTS
jgi:hypothetical protein